MLRQKSKPGPEAFDADLKPDKTLADAAFLLSLVDSGALRIDKPIFTGVISEKRLSADEEHELARRIQIWGDIDARNALVMANIGLVHMIVGQMLRAGYKFEDLLQEGTIGLIRATESFQPDRNIRFSTYAAFWIRSKIQRFIETHRKEDSPVMTQEKSSPRARKMSLDRTMGSNGEEFSLGETIASNIESPEEIALRSERTTAVRDVLTRIVLELKNPHLQAIIERRILADEPESLESLGKKLHISRETCRLLENKMLRLAKQELICWKG